MSPLRRAWQRYEHENNPTDPYTSYARIRKGRSVVHTEAKTFSHRTAALTWAQHREILLENPPALTRVQQGAPTLAELIRWYMETFARISKWQRTKLPVWPEIVKEVRDACAELRLTGKSRKRSRRPTPEELERLRDYVARRDRCSRIPMQAVITYGSL